MSQQILFDLLCAFKFIQEEQTFAEENILLLALSVGIQLPIQLWRMKVQQNNGGYSCIYIQHVQDRKNKATAALTKLYRLRDLPEKIKIHLVKALVIPILQYPPIPLHTMSRRQISFLQKVHNKALRFATNQRYPYTMTTEEINAHTYKNQIYEHPPPRAS